MGKEKLKDGTVTIPGTSPPNAVPTAALTALVTTPLHAKRPATRPTKVVVGVHTRVGHNAVRTGHKKETREARPGIISKAADVTVLVIQVSINGTIVATSSGVPAVTAPNDSNCETLPSTVTVPQPGLPAVTPLTVGHVDKMVLVSTPTIGTPLTVIGNRMGVHPADEIAVGHVCTVMPSVVRLIHSPVQRMLSILKFKHN